MSLLPLPPTPIAAIFSFSLEDVRRVRKPPPETQPKADTAVPARNVRREIFFLFIVSTPFYCASQGPETTEEGFARVAADSQPSTESL